ncbi:MAG TPA: TonB-dependent receptor [Methylococcaceae bacterium]|jgi:iron complex outermembrane receptor protein|nr:TonB-dependent receptor [Methylococcaceae bacterium]
MQRLGLPILAHLVPFRKILLSLVCLPAITGTASAAEETASSTQSLTELSLEQLLDIEITSVSKQTKRLSDSPAAVFVITQDDIHRSGASTIADALRMVPGLQVARVDRDKWAISARGFNDVFANKLLVLMDGRSVYTPLFSGVWWDSQDTMLEDIERIEVIRGPGASVWGSNAVNGVINIITKQAKNTQGGLLSASSGNLESGTVSLRYGGRLGERTDYRIYGKYFDRDAYDNAQGKEAGDDWRAGRGGFRIDSRLTDEDSLTVQGDIFKGDSGGAPIDKPSLSPPYESLASGDQRINGANVLTRWKRRLSESSDFALQAYYDRNDRRSPAFGTRFTINTFDIDFQHDFRVSDWHRVIWGGGYRYLQHETEDSFTFSLIPSERSDNLFNLFAQDEITLIPERLKLTLGSKLEHKNTVGFQVQPSGRVLWSPDRKNSIWASVSRAVRLPTWTEQDSRLNPLVAPPDLPLSPLPTLFTIQGTRKMEPEEVLAYELGYRAEPTRHLALDLALFYNVYHRLQTIEPQDCVTRVSAGYEECLSLFSNKQEGEAYGLELSADWRLLDSWRLQGGYTLLVTDLRPTHGSNNQTQARADEGKDPRNQFFLRSSLDLPAKTQFDLMLRYVDQLPSINIGDYLTLDTRLAWRPAKNIELSLIGRNLTQEHHAEFAGTLALTPTLVEREFLAALRWGF